MSGQTLQDQITQLAATVTTLQAQLKEQKQEVARLKLAQPLEIAQAARKYLPTSRRRLLKTLLVGVLTSGATVATLVETSQVQAKMVVNSAGNPGATFVPGKGSVTNAINNAAIIGLVATSEASLDLNTLPPVNMGVFGFSGGGNAVRGDSTSGTGVSGNSGSSNGVSGTSTSGAGLYGTSKSGTGVYGYCQFNGIGIFGQCTDGTGIKALSTNGAGVDATSTNYFAVNAVSTNNAAVYAESANYAAVSAKSPNSYGIIIESGSAIKPQLYLKPKTISGPPASPSAQIGEIWLDQNGDVYIYTSTPTASWKKVQLA